MTSTKCRASSPYRSRSAGAVDALEQPEEAVDHRVADQLDPIAADPLGGEVLDRVLGGAEQQIRDPVGDHAVHLLGHSPVTGAETRLDVGDGDLQLGRGERRPHRRVDVARHQDHVSGIGEQICLDPGEHARGLLRVGAGADLEVGVGLAHSEALDEPSRECPVVVLARVQHADRDPLGFLERGDHRSGLDEVRSRPHHREH